MGFDLSNLFSYQTKNDSYSSSSAIKGGEGAVGMKADDHTISTKNLADYPKGSSITGQVVSMENDMVLLKLSDNSYVNAKLEQDLNVSVGQKLTFEVKSNSGNTLSLTPLFTNMNTNTNVIKGLEAANIPINDTSIEMITAMMDKGMSIDTGNLQNMYRQVLAYPQMSPSNLVEMKELSIPITKENVAQFEAYQNYEHQVLAGVEEIVRNVEQTCLDLIKNGDVSEAVKLYKEITAMLSEASAGLENGENSLKGTVFLENMVLEENGILSEQIHVAKGNPLEDGAVLPEEIINLPLEQTADINNEDGNIVQKLATANQTATENGTSLEASVESELTGILNKSERAVLANHLTEFGVSKGITQAVSNGDISMKQLMAVLSHVSEFSQAGDKLQRLYTSKEFRTLINRQLTNEFLLTPEQVATKGKVSEFYNKLTEQAMRLSEALSMVGKDNSALAKSVNNLQKNVDFINQINQTFAYVQLPLKLSQGNGHGDLYVYTNKRNLAKQEGNISALLHLDMEHIGPVDVYVAMTNGDHVNTKFYLKDDEMLDFIESNIHLLNERLEKRGYHAKAEFLVKETGEEKGFGQKLLGKEEEKPVVVSTQAFDMRA